MPMWTWLVPVLSFGLLLIAGVASVGLLLVVLCGAALLGTVIAAVHHAEVIAHRVGEPLGTLVLALAVTIIEASLILSMMIAGGEEMADAPPRHHLRGHHDHLQRRGRHLSARGRPRSSRADLSCRRLGRGHGRADRHVDAHARDAGVYDDDGRGYLQHVAAPVRGCDLRSSLGCVRFYSDRFSSRLLHSGVERGASGGTCRAADNE